MLKNLLEEKSLINNYIEDQHDIDIALELESLELDEVIEFINAIDIERFANILVEANPEFIVDVLAKLSLNKIVDLLSHMNTDDAVDILGYVEFGVQKSLLRKMKQDDQELYKMLLGYETDSAGGLMTTEYIALRANLTVDQAFIKLRKIARDINEDFTTIYIVDKTKRLIGILGLKDLFLAGEDELLSDIMEEMIVTVNVADDQEEVANLVSKYDLNVIPVVNNRNQILGIITVDDVIDVLIEEQSEDILRLGGVVTDETDETFSIRTSIKARLPWLTINLATAFLAALVVGQFGATIEHAVVLAFAMPIVAGMGGNAGTQSLSIMIRNIAIYDASLATEWKKMYKEIIVGFFNGSVTGFLAAIVLSVAYQNIYIGLVILIAMVGNLMVAGLFGFIIPLILKALKIDPALASTIFITTATDIFGFFFFLSMGTLFLPLLP